MQFENVNIQNLVTEYRDFSVEGFNIFALGKDHLPHLICVCPNKSFARAVQSLLAVAKSAMALEPANGDINSDSRLLPRMLVDGKLVVESKAGPRLPSDVHPQTFSFLAATDFEVALILHFGKDAKVYRVVFENRFKYRCCNQL